MAGCLFFDVPSKIYRRLSQPRMPPSVEKQRDKNKTKVEQYTLDTRHIVPSNGLSGRFVSFVVRKRPGWQRRQTLTQSPQQRTTVRSAGAAGAETSSPGGPGTRNRCDREWRACFAQIRARWTQPGGLLTSEVPRLDDNVGREKQGALRIARELPRRSQSLLLVLGLLLFRFGDFHVGRHVLRLFELDRARSFPVPRGRRHLLGGGIFRPST